MLKFVMNDYFIFFNIVVLMGLIWFMNVLEDCYIDVYLYFVEVNILIYGICVDFNNVKVDLFLNVCCVFFLIFDCSELNESYEKVFKIYDYFVKEESLFKINFENGNLEVYFGLILLNVGCIDYLEEFFLYKEGIIKYIVRLLYVIEIECLNLGRKLGFELLIVKELCI